MSETVAKVIVAIDGPSGAGKSSVARGLATRLGLPYLETGAMYRALGLKVIEEGVDPGDRAAVAALAARFALTLEARADGAIEVLLDGRPLGDRIRSPEVDEVTSRISVYPEVRRRLVGLQRAGAGMGGAVVEGRDIGTKVFPDTPFKFFLDAPPAERARRRHEQLRRAGSAERSLDEIEQEVRERDRRDSSRTDSPLVWDETYHRVETGGLELEEVVDLIAAAVRRRGA